MYFRNRQQAGVIIANSLFEKYRNRNPVVAAIPRGGVPVAQPVAYLLDAPLMLVSSRKIGAPENPEFGIGAVSEDGQVWMNYQEIGSLKFDQGEINRSIDLAMSEMSRQKTVYESFLKPIDLRGRTVILVDDGLATGSTMLASIRSLRSRGAEKVVVAVPVASEEGSEQVRIECDDFFSAYTPRYFSAVGRWYEDFSQVSDSEVIRLLESVNFPPNQDITTRETVIEVDHARTLGMISYPRNCKAWIILAHENETDSNDPRNPEIVHQLNEAGYGTLQFDFYTPDEASIRKKIEAPMIDLEFLSKRLSQVTRWLKTRPEWKRLPIGYFGVGVNAAASLEACANLEPRTFAVVSRSGKTDLVTHLDQVSCPVLLLAGSEDPETLTLNRTAEKELRNSRLVVIPGAHQRFEETGVHAHAIALAKEWFDNQLKQYRREQNAVA